MNAMSVRWKITYSQQKNQTSNSPKSRINNSAWIRYQSLLVAASTCLQDYISCWLSIHDFQLRKRPWPFLRTLLLSSAFSRHYHCLLKIVKASYRTVRDVLQHEDLPFWNRKDVDSMQRRSSILAVFIGWLSWSIKWCYRRIHDAQRT